MKKALRNIVLGATCATMVLAFTGTGCGSAVDTELRPVALAIGALDQNFNPFLYTSANDGEVIGMTQISMLTSDESGSIVCGEDQATMVLDYTVNSYDVNGQIASGDSIDYTTYEFVIKNGVKDSMGYDMGIKDVLFNLYVYLDPLYTGSSTIYSTKIKGLASYRAQQDLGEDSTYDYEEEFKGDATLKFNALLNYDDSTASNRPSFESVKPDIQELAKLFLEELNSDYTSIKGTVSSYTEYRFTEDWQLFLFNEGLVKYQYKYNENNKLEKYKDENGKFYTTLDPKQPNAQSYEENAFATRMKEAMDAGKSEQEAAVEIVFEKYFYEVEDGVYDGSATGMITEILTQWASGNSLMQKFINDAISAKYDGSDELQIKEISGITTRKTNTFNGKNLGEEHDVLTIKINGVDPAAIYNFAFTVAPMHYYSGVGEDGTDYVARCNEHWDDKDYSNRFGVQFSNSYFMEKVLGSERNQSSPVGAGAYKMKEGATFYNGSMVSYERNEYFTTLGSQINNAKIKYLNYVYTSDDQLLNSLINTVVDYATPNCTPKNIEELARSGSSYLNSRNYLANGYGYVGINPTAVPDREVRVAIMLALNPQLYIIDNYYTSQYSEELFRPTSKTNFLNNYDKTGALTSYFTSSVGLTNGITYKYTADDNVIINLVESAGWRNTTGVYTKGDKTLKLTFTIAGESTDHPAWQMFTKAAEQLNAIGFDITVKNDMNALISLATGKLEVWAAAWTTGIDPDMYQLYHKDSNASSTKNWGYDTILNNPTIYAEENEILNDLSAEIDLARSNVNEEYRTIHYVNALNGVMELAVEYPTYQRRDLAVYNKNVINPSSLNQNPSANAGLLFKIWELDYV